METTLTVEVHLTGVRALGGWCPVCLLPSVVTYGVALVWAETLVVFAFEEMRVCDECGTRLDHNANVPP